MLHFKLDFGPFSSNGYAVRTHGIATALLRAGVRVVVASRPGMPWDRQVVSHRDLSCRHDIDGVCYLHRPAPSARAGAQAAYLLACVDAWTELIQVFKPAAVMAASNWKTALPVAIAAHELGVPFFYDVRGFWEISHPAQVPDWRNSEAYLQAVKNETAVARCARKVFTLNRFMRDELMRRGIAAERVELVPHVFPAWPHPLVQKNPVQRENIAARHIIGYIGSFNYYEGLELLIEAFALLRQRGVDAALLLVGSSESSGFGCGKQCPVTKKYKQLASQLGVVDYLLMPGRINPEQVASCYALLDVVVIPRLPLPVCELISPIKPLEAALFGKPVLMSDVAPLIELAGIYDDFHYFPKGDMRTLADKLAALLLAGNGSSSSGVKSTEMDLERAASPMVRAIYDYGGQENTRRHD